MDSRSGWYQRVPQSGLGILNQNLASHRCLPPCKLHIEVSRNLPFHSALRRKTELSTREPSRAGSPISEDCRSATSVEHAPLHCDRLRNCPSRCAWRKAGAVWLTLQLEWNRLHEPSYAGLQGIADSFARSAAISRLGFRVTLRDLRNRV